MIPLLLLPTDGQLPARCQRKRERSRPEPAAPASTSPTTASAASPPSPTKTPPTPPPAPGPSPAPTRYDPWGRPRTDRTAGSTTPADTTTSSPSATGPADPTATQTGTRTNSDGLTPNPCATSTTNSTPTTNNDAFYRGERRDTGTGTYQLGTRTYDPAKAAFLSQDTYRQNQPHTDLAVGTDPLTSNRYNYVNGDPVNGRDPTGHYRCDADDRANGCTEANASPTQQAQADQRAAKHQQRQAANDQAAANSDDPRTTKQIVRAQDSEFLEAGAAEYYSGGKDKDLTKRYRSRLERIGLRIMDGKRVGALELEHYQRYRSEEGEVKPDPVLQAITDVVASAGFLSLREAVAEGATFVLEKTGGGLVDNLLSRGPPEVAADPRLGDNKEKTDSVYLRRSAQGVYNYAGRTNDVDRRAGEHGKRLRDLDELPELTRAESRSVEEALISKGLGRPLNYTNGRHEISSSRKDYNYTLTVAYGETLLAEAGYAP